MQKKRILIIKLGALGDVVMSTGAIRAIREQHPDAHISILTTPPMMMLLKANPYVDEFLMDERKKPWHLFYMYDLYKKLQGWDMVYDLQKTGRTNGLYHILAGKPQWSGIAKGCSHPQPTDTYLDMHSVDSLNDQLKHAGITADYWPDITYARQDASSIIQKHGLDMDKTIVLVPGCSAHREMKRWTRYDALTNVLMEQGYKVVLIGTNAEGKVLKDIEDNTGCINLCNQTSIGQLIDLTNKAFRVIGNDTGPMHMAAASAAKGVTIFGYASDPVRSAPRGEGMSVIKKEDIDAITPQEVMQAALITA